MPTGCACCVRSPPSPRAHSRRRADKPNPKPYPYPYPNPGPNPKCCEVELLAGALTRSPLGIEALAAEPDWFGPTRHGELLLALDPAAFGDDGFF